MSDILTGASRIEKNFMKEVKKSKPKIMCDRGEINKIFESSNLSS